MEAGLTIEVEGLRDPLAVRENLRSRRILALRQHAEFFKHRQIDRRLGIAGRARVAIPVPDPAEIPGAIDDSQAFHPGFAELGAEQQPAKARADDRNFDLVGERCARRRSAKGRVFLEPMVVAPVDTHELAQALWAEPSIALGTIFGAQRDRVDAECVRERLQRIGHAMVCKVRRTAKASL